MSLSNKIMFKSVNSKGNYCATSNNTKLVDRRLNTPLHDVLTQRTAMKGPIRGRDCQSILYAAHTSLTYGVSYEVETINRQHR